MALNKLKYNSLNLTPAANKAIGFDSDADALEATISGGSMTFIKKLTASSSSTLSFVDGSSDVVLDSTYNEYIFIFTNIHPSPSGNAHFLFNLSADTGSNYNVTKTTTAFHARHDEGDGDTTLSYSTSSDLAQSTAFQQLTTEVTFPIATNADEHLCGTLHLFNPSSTTFVKHFISETLNYSSTYSTSNFIAGYGNTTSAVDAVQFKMTSGNIDAGTITLYGIN